MIGSTPPPRIKNQAQSRKFHIVHLTHNKSTPAVQFLEGVCGNSLRVYLQGSSNSSRKENAKIFTKCVPIKHNPCGRGLKCTLRISYWLRSVANGKTRISIFHADRYSVRQNGFRHDTVYTVCYDLTKAHFNSADCLNT